MKIKYLNLNMSSVIKQFRNISVNIGHEIKQFVIDVDKMFPDIKQLFQWEILTRVYN